MTTAAATSLAKQGEAALRSGDAAVAVDLLYEATALEPGHAEAQRHLSLALRRLGRVREAVEPFLRAEEKLPELTVGLAPLVKILASLDFPAEAGEVLRRWVAREPLSYVAWLRLEEWSRFEDLQEEALHAADRAEKLRPFALSPRLARCMARLRIVYDREEEIDEARAAYRDELERVAAWVEGNLSRIEDPACIGSYQPFFLPYQARNDRDLQRRLGGIVTRVMQQAYPRWGRRPPMPPVVPGEPLRIGFVSGFFRMHSVWKMRLCGWMREFDGGRFRLHAYYTSKRSDGVTRQARAGFDSFVESQPLEAMAERIRRDRLHALVYPELGMNRQALCLAALRLAPLQFLSWSHPETSGLSTFDAFVSSDLMEPPDGESHYSERMIRLPGLGVAYQPLDATPAAPDWAALGLRDDTRLYLCAQNPSKILPRHDELFARIAAAVPESQFLFLDAHHSHSSTHRMMARLAAAFAARGLDPDRHLVLLPKLSRSAYAALNRRCHVFLDTIGWNGANTTLEALAAGLPVVTLPGALMRGRHSLAILRRAGIEHGIASSAEQYVDLAVRWGRDETVRQEISRAVVAGIGRIYSDTDAVPALQDFLEAEVFRAAETG